jgi:hypothetical protein
LSERHIDAEGERRIEGASGVIVGGWARVGCARHCGVHSEPPTSVGRALGSCRSRGAVPLSDTIIPQFLHNLRNINAQNIVNLC